MPQLTLLCSLLAHHDGRVRQLSAQVLGVAATATDAAACTALLQQLHGAVTNTVEASRHKATELEAREGAVHALAYVAAHAAHGV